MFHSEKASARNYKRRSRGGGCEGKQTKNCMYTSSERNKNRNLYAKIMFGKREKSFLISWQRKFLGMFAGHVMFVSRFIDSSKIYRASLRQGSCRGELLIRVSIIRLTEPANLPKLKQFIFMKITIPSRRSLSSAAILISFISCEKR